MLQVNMWITCAACAPHLGLGALGLALARAGPELVTTRCVRVRACVCVFALAAAETVLFILAPRERGGSGPSSCHAGSIAATRPGITDLA